MAAISQTDLDYKNHTTKFLVISLLLHFALMLAFSRSWLTRDAETTASTKSLEVEVVPLSKQDIDRIKSQIVETELTDKSEKAVKDAYLSAQTQVVNKQTRAKTTAPFQSGKTGGAGQSQSQAENKVAASNLGVRMNMKPMGNLGPGQMAATSDYLNNVQQGAQTLLNTKEFAYFSFYQRVRKQLEQYWEPGLRNRLRNMFEKGRQLAADREHKTHLTVVMNNEGLITRILVESTSGFLDLDQAAIDAFNKAGPFPNPPRGMIDSEGTVKVEWEFVLKT